MDGLTFLEQPWVSSLIGILGIAVGILIAAYFYWKSKISSKLTYQTKGFRIIGKSGKLVPDELKILYGDKEIDDLNRDTITIWNSGNSTLDRDKIVESNLLRIVYSNDTLVFRVNLLKRTRVENGFRFKIPNVNYIDFEFDYLDPGDGVVLEIFYSGPQQSPKIIGTIKGLPKGPEGYVITDESFKIRIHPKFQKFLQNFVDLIIISYFLIGPFVLIIYGVISNEVSVILVGTSILILAIIFLYRVYWKKRRRYPKTLQI